MPKTIKDDINTTWTINGDSKTWTLQEQASITVNGVAAIDVLDTSVGNTLKLMGDIIASSDGGIGVDVNGMNTKIMIGKQAEIDADKGIDASAAGLKVINKGEIDGLAYGIGNSGASNIKNFGDISGDSGITTLGTSRVVNGEHGTIQGDFAGVNMSAGSDSIVINHGLISGNEFAVRISNGGEAKLINTGTIHGDILLGNGDNLLDSTKGVIEGSVTGGDGDDVYKIGKNDIDIIEENDHGIDRVYSRITHELNEYVENLFLVGKGNASAWGNDEDNILTGNKGRNTLLGGEGDDVIGGGRGDDTMTGDDGADTFVFKFGGDRDIITDFEVGTDKINLVGFDNASNFEELQTEMFKNGNDVWIQLGNGDRLIIQNTDVGDLDANHFNFVS